MLVPLPLYFGVTAPRDCATPVRTPLAWEASGIIRMVFRGPFEDELYEIRSWPRNETNFQRVPDIPQVGFQAPCQKLAQLSLLINGFATAKCQLERKVGHVGRPGSSGPLAHCHCNSSPKGESASHALSPSVTPSTLGLDLQFGSTNALPQGFEPSRLPAVCNSRLHLK
jgi:hypothetical protein